jgi:hypothetical protein
VKQAKRKRPSRGKRDGPKMLIQTLDLTGDGGALPAYPTIRREHAVVTVDW